MSEYLKYLLEKCGLVLLDGIFVILLVMLCGFIGGGIIAVFFVFIYEISKG